MQNQHFETIVINKAKWSKRFIYHIGFNTLRKLINVFIPKKKSPFLQLMTKRQTVEIILGEWVKQLCDNKMVVAVVSRQVDGLCRLKVKQKVTALHSSCINNCLI
jgi:hypothetical protein